MFSSVLLDSGTSFNFIAAPQILKYSNNIQNSFLFPFEPMEVHLDDYYSVISHQIVYLPLNFVDDAVHTVEFWLVSALNRDKILGMPLLNQLNPSIDWQKCTFTCGIPNLPLFHLLLFLQYL